MANDILLTTDNELQFKNGDFLTGYSDDQHIQHHMTANPGNYLQHPFLGIGLTKEKNGPVNRGLIASAIRKSLVEDGFNVREIRVEGNFDNLEIEVNAVMK